MYSSRWIRGIITGDTGKLNILLGSGERVFGEARCIWYVMAMGQSDWEILVKDDL